MVGVSYSAYSYTQEITNQLILITTDHTIAYIYYQTVMRFTHDLVFVNIGNVLRATQHKV